MKRLLQITLGFIALIVVLLTAAALLISPNQFRPLLKDLAAEQGIALEMGNLGWTFWPRLGVSLADVSVAPLATPDAPVAKFSDAGLLLAIKPLLRGEFEVDYLRLTNADINLIQDAQGVGNWEALLQDAPENPEPTPESADSKPLALAIERITLSNARVSFQDLAQALRVEVRDINFDVQDLNLDAREFPVSLGFTLGLNAANAANDSVLQASLKQSLSINRDLSKVQIKNGRATLGFTDQASAEASLGYALTLDNPTGALAYQGAFKLDTINARHWLKALAIELETADAKALSAIELTSDFAGDSTRVSLNNIALQLDQTAIAGQFAIEDFSKNAIAAALSIDAINLDHYLPPPAPANDQSAAAEIATEASADVALPLELLRALQIDLTLNAGELQAKKFTLSDLAFSLKSHKGAFTQTLTAKTYEGSLDLNSAGVTRPDSLQASIDADLAQVQIAPIMAAQALDKNLTLSGAVNADVKAKLTGASVNQLIESMDLRAQFNGAQVRLAPLNIEQRVCQAINLITERQLHDLQWDAFTEMRALKGDVVWQNQVITFKDVNAGVSQLSVSALGALDLAKGKFNIGLPINILEAGATAASSNCSLATEMQWLNRSLTLLRCRGDLADMNLAKDCGPDKDALVQLTADYAKYKLREKHGDKIDAAEARVDAEKQKLSDKVSEKLGVSAGEELNVQSALGGLLRKKLNTSAATSEAAVETNESGETTTDSTPEEPATP